MKRIFVTGTAGFIGYHLAKRLISLGHEVCGYDGLTDYYDVSLKNHRCELLGVHDNFQFHKGLLENSDLLNQVVKNFKPDVIIHLAAQAGVRYSLENPRAYIDANLVGTFNIMEAAKSSQIEHLLMASTSSVYGANTDMPFCETQNTDHPLTIYAATKKANEVMAHSYAHLWKLPTTMFRFFTVYGPLGRPDLALYKFVSAILENKPIDIYNHGNMYRDFTYIDDLVKGISMLIDAVPIRPDNMDYRASWDSLSPVAPFRVVNIGNSDKVRLMDFIEAIEAKLGRPAIKNFMEIQPGDVPATWANSDLLYNLTGYRPNTHYVDGIAKFIDWYCEYRGIQNDV